MIIPTFEFELHGRKFNYQNSGDTSSCGLYVPPPLFHKVNKRLLEAIVEKGDLSEIKRDSTQVWSSMDPFFSRGDRDDFARFAHYLCKEYLKSEDMPANIDFAGFLYRCKELPGGNIGLILKEVTITHDHSEYNGNGLSSRVEKVQFYYFYPI